MNCIPHVLACIKCEITPNGSICACNSVISRALIFHVVLFPYVSAQSKAIVFGVPYTNIVSGLILMSFSVKKENSTRHAFLPLPFSV